MIGHCFATLLAILSLLLVAAQSVPLNWTQPPPCIPAHGSPLNPTDAFISDAVTKLSLEELLPEAGSLNQSEVSAMFAEDMCPLFRHYTLYSIFARQHLHNDETGSFTHSALISLLLQNVLELSCNFIKTSFPESEEWSRLNCTMGSMARFCFSLDTHQELTSLLLTGAPSNGNPNPDAPRVQSWLRKTVPGREPIPGVLQNLFPLLHNLFSECDLPADATAEQITCMPFVNQSRK